jgi:hypothetical protein
MTIHEIGTPVGGTADGLWARMRPATELPVGGAQVARCDDVGRRAADVIVPRPLTRC